ncbi:MAG TPA: indole-3-glycerol phosphate synthase TrpC [Solirubrobacteraceae bacterium]|jgi:indole-3-glycerol phosphate synthase|nr:indole-3-glycerol phosphate synthase TrpC [Solirubrobacteraceae bacterium]
MTVLERIVAETREELERRRRERPQPPEPAGAPPAGRLHDALAGDRIAVIAEFKRRSPSAGELSERPDLDAAVRAYAEGGAAALSILTEGPNFGGSLEDLARARELCDLPLLRKDFVVDAYQLHEARAAGADAVLLIVAALAPGELASLHEQAAELGLDSLVEVHDESEVEVALGAGARIVGVNNRDLRDFSVDVGRTGELLHAIPPGVIVVSESGIAGAEQVRQLHDAGVHAVLVGETLMRAGDPAAALRGLQSI